MIKYDKGVTWYRISTRRQCPKKLERMLLKEKEELLPIHPATAMGLVVQRCFQLFFNYDLNLARDESVHPRIMSKILDRVMESPWFTEDHRLLPGMIDKEECYRQFANGLQQFKEIGILRRKVVSEEGVSGKVLNLPMYAMVDFLSMVDDGWVVTDGKGKVKKDADPDQIRLYSAIVTASGKKVVKAGFHYWKFERFDEISMSGPEFQDFWDRLREDINFFLSLRTGVSEGWEAKSSWKNCRYCGYKKVCSSSYFYNYTGDEESGVDII